MQQTASAGRKRQPWCSWQRVSAEVDEDLPGTLPRDVFVAWYVSHSEVGFIRWRLRACTSPRLRAPPAARRRLALSPSPPSAPLI